MRSTDRSVSLLRVLVPLFSLVIAHVTSLIQLPNLQLLQSPHGGKYSVPSWSALTNNLAGCPSDTYILTTFKVKTVESPRLEWVPARVGSPIDELEALQLVSMEGLNMDSAHSAYVELDDIAVRVLQEQGLEGMKQLLERKCGAKSMVLDLKAGGLEMIDKNLPRIILGEFFDVPNRDSILASRDVMVQNESQRKEIHSSIVSLLGLLPTQSVTIIFFTQPSSESAIIDPSVPHQYEDSQAPMHNDLRKRSDEVYLSASKTAISKNSTSSSTPTALPMPSNLPVFEKYSFFSPGIFAGLGITFLLAMILVVAVRGVASIEIPYGAFERDSNPQQAAKNQ